jgi:molybdate transport system permease protein
MSHRRLHSVVALLIATPLIILLAIPFLTLVVSLSDIAWLWKIEDDSSAFAALGLSLKTSSISATITLISGTPIAWFLAKNKIRLTWLLQAIILVPMFLPPSIVGLTLLSALTQKGWLVQICPFLDGVPFSMEAVIIAQLVVASPLYVMGATAVFKRISPELTEVARTFGSTPWDAWRRVTLPMMLPGLLIALSLSWARSIGEFGATLLFAGHLPGVTQTAPLAIYLELERGTVGALALSLALVGYMLPMFAIVAWLGRTKWRY